MMRRKYSDELTTPDGKRRLPFFFAHISKQKGYYDPDSKAYLKYDTTMDYLQTIVNSFRVKSPYKKKYLPFTTILDSKRYRRNAANIEQANAIIEEVKTYIDDRKRIYGSINSTIDEKHSRSQLLYDNLITTINSKKIGYHTMYYLLSQLETKDFTSIRNVLLDVLFMCGNDSFNQCIIQSAEEINVIDGYGDDVYMFGKGYKVTKISVNSGFSDC